MSHGAEGERWLEELPARVAALEREWSVTAGAPFEADGCVSWVAPVRCVEGGEAVLKISIPHREARYEAGALEVWDGRGAVRLLRASEDGFTLLLERCVPGTQLAARPEEEQDVVVAGLLRRLWQAPIADRGCRSGALSGARLR